MVSAWHSFQHSGVSGLKKEPIGQQRGTSGSIREKIYKQCHSHYWPESSRRCPLPLKTHVLFGSFKTPCPTLPEAGPKRLRRDQVTASDLVGRQLAGSDPAQNRLWMLVDLSLIHI